MIGGVKVAAPAKLNLSLRILGKRDDGFHELDSVMVALPELHDELELSASEADGLACDDEGVPTGPENLVWRAVEAFRAATGARDPLSLRLTKRIPHGAGLGGGSSDAAAALRALDEWFGTALGRERLCALGASVGSDVPFFLGPPVARVRGRGEILEEGPAVPPLPVVLLKPAFAVSTPGAYRAWQGAEAIPGIDYEPQCFAWGELVNDLERPVFQKHRFLAEARQWLRERPEVAGALMSGSGSTVFAVFGDGASAEGLIAAAREALDPGLWAWSGWTAGGAG